MRQKTENKNGFSLTEVLLAAGVLAMGFVLIALVFPVGIKLTSMSAEKTMSPVIAEEAKNIVWLYGLDPLNPLFTSTISTYSKLFSSEYLTSQSLRYYYREMKDYTLAQFDPDDPVTYPIPAGDFPALYTYINDQLAEDSLYPSLPAEEYPDQTQRYCWIALCRYNTAAPTQPIIQIFVCRRIEGARYYNFRFDPLTQTFRRNPSDSLTSADYTDRPIPVPISIHVPSRSNPLAIVPVTIVGPTGEGPVYPLQLSHQFFTEGTGVVEDTRGEAFEITNREDTNNDGIYETLTLSRAWPSAYPSTAFNTILWVVPPAVGTSRNLCIEVQKAQ